MLIASCCLQNFRTRKCSIVTEEDDEEDDDIGGVSGSGSEDLSSACSLNRRGSRSEGKLSAMVKDRIAAAELERRKEKLGVSQSAEEAPTSRPPSSPIAVAAPAALDSPVTSPRLKGVGAATPNAIPAPRQPSVGMLNEICEELESVFHVAGRPGRVSPRPIPTYDQRRSKFHKNRTASCSSSDASDDDSESRKKRAHKLKNIPQRRDSHDDSSDSQDPGGGGGGGGNTGGGGSNMSGGGLGNREPQDRTEPSGGGSDGNAGGDAGSAGGGGDRGGAGGPGSAGAPGNVAHRSGRRARGRPASGRASP